MPTNEYIIENWDIYYYFFQVWYGTYFSYLQKFKLASNCITNIQYGTVFNRRVCEKDLIQYIIQDSEKRYFHSRDIKSSYNKDNILSLPCATQYGNNICYHFLVVDLFNKFLHYLLAGYLKSGESLLCLFFNLERFCQIFLSQICLILSFKFPSFTLFPLDWIIQISQKTRSKFCCRIRRNAPI